MNKIFNEVGMLWGSGGEGLLGLCPLQLLISTNLPRYFYKVFKNCEKYVSRYEPTSAFVLTLFAPHYIWFIKYLLQPFRVTMQEPLLQLFYVLRKKIFFYVTQFFGLLISLLISIIPETGATPPQPGNNFTNIILPTTHNQVEV